jgi:hypothetical protein
MIEWPWLLAAIGATGILSFFAWKSPAERAAWVRRHIVDDDPAQDESHSATRYGTRTTAPRMRVLPEEVEERIRAEWAKAEEVEPDIEAHR